MSDLKGEYLKIFSKDKEPKDVCQKSKTQLEYVLGYHVTVL